MLVQFVYLLYELYFLQVNTSTNEFPECKDIGKQRRKV